MKNYNSIIIVGPTASGKTRLATHLAYSIQGAVLSFDSRQVYNELNIGTGKDLDEYLIENTPIPYYLINECDINSNFHSYEFVKSYIHAFKQSELNNQVPILCGGTGLYFDLALKQHQFINIPVNEILRLEIQDQSENDLLTLLQNYNPAFTQQADKSTKKRLIRAIEIADYLSKNTHHKIEYPGLKPIIFGIELKSKERNKQIDKRLKQRLENGLIEEVEQLLAQGIKPERLIFLGLEYKFITEYLQGKYNKEEMINLLQTAIHQYAKRQMTWFRKMEREGNLIHWIDGNLTKAAQIQSIQKIITSLDT